MSVEVSTIIPAYNAERTIVQAIDSALSQHCEGHEVLVVNDGSTDSTAAILQKYGNRIQVITQHNGGASAARNAGCRRSIGRYLAFLDSDDVWLPGKLKTMVTALARNPLASLAFSDYTVIAEDGAECGESAFGDARALEQLMSERPLPAYSFPTGILPSTWMIPRQVFDRTGGFREEFPGQGCEDAWMLVLLRELGEFEYVPERLILHRAGDPISNPDKYAPALPIFISLVKERYGARGRQLIRNARNLHCRMTLSKAAHQMNNGDRLGAICSLVSIIRLRPAYFLGSEFLGRLVLPQNLKRVRDLAALTNPVNH
jgi:glycosyltransferase involved in cell wall biosynthesis